MAEMQNTSNVVTRTFSGGLNKDIDRSFLKENMWAHARNAINNSKAGNLGVLGNEPSNKYCVSTPYTLIGAIHLHDDKWVVFSTDNLNSEIGVFDESDCSYTRVVNDTCLGFTTYNLITGASKENFDCTWQVYWQDGLNPDRTLNIDKVPFKENCVVVNDCLVCTPTTQLDCDKIRLARIVETPCLRVEKGAASGTLLNGSYYAVAAYTINGQTVTDYFPPSNVQPLFEHDNVAGSIDIYVDAMDTDIFTEFELVVVATVNQQTVARRVGLYSTRQRLITLDMISNELISIPIEKIPIMTPVFDKSDGIYEVGDYLIRSGPTTKLDFNYQPLANQIRSKWASIEYNTDYYRKGGNAAGYLRDEIYPFFIRWVYDTGDRSPSFHIPGRASVPTDLQVLAGPDAQIEINDGLTPYRWRVENTATVTSLATSTLPDGGFQIAEGEMGYWESTEIYPNNMFQIWGGLCGKPIRHHRFPDNALHPTTNHFNPGATKIRVMGVKFENIQVPVDLNNNPIDSITGYEILRGSRDGNKTVVAKGIINNMGKYTIDANITNRQGVYPNYPYNDLRPDFFLSTTKTNTTLGIVTNLNPHVNFTRDLFTFHSPDTQFNNPFLSMKELKIYGEFAADVEGQFIQPDKHPKHKLITDVTFFVSLIAGIGTAMVALSGKRKVIRIGPRRINLGGVFAGPTSGAQPIDLGVGGAAAEAAWAAGYGLTTTGYFDTGVGLGLNILGQDSSAYYASLYALNPALSLLPGTQGYTTNIEQEDGLYSTLPLPIRILQTIPTFSYYMNEGAENVLRIIKALLPFRQYALEYISHGEYNRFTIPQVNNNRRPINDAIYLNDQIQDFGPNLRINNLYRGRAVAVQLNGTFLDPIVTDNTRQRVADTPGTVTHSDPYDKFSTQSSVHYAAMKQRLRNQYGQLDGIRQVVVPNCVVPKATATSPVLFGGDTYVTRYTEKNMMPFFYDWLYGQPDGSEWDYLIRKNIPWPSYWMDTTEYDINEFFQSILSNPLNPSAWITPSDRHALDRGLVPAGLFGVKKAFMYLFSCGVRDFFVESEINTDLRDWGEDLGQRHYDPYRFTDLKALFNTSVIKTGNYFKYDISLSIARIFNEHISWGSIQSRDYDPLVAQTCYSYYPNRLIYSLPQQLELKKDNWRIYLVNNYKDFKSKITTVKSVNKNGALILFESDLPVEFQGLDALETDLGTKLTIGDGGLFSQPMQSLVNADTSYEYGSCQNKLSAINTPMGVFYVCQNQGKIFQVTNGLQEISNQGMKWWFAQYLPYVLTQDFPTFELTDNPVTGIGCMSIYNNQDGLVYFTKKDYKLRTDITDIVSYFGNNIFLVNGILPVTLGDTRYFEDASWTLSFDPKIPEGGAWISHHDWHPTYLLPAKNHFMSVSGNSIWKHNDRCDSYCNFYGIDYPFELEYPASTGQMVNTTRSLEYLLECYRYLNNCFDAFHVLDFNFDEAVVYNSEQVSGLLRLNISPKNNPMGILQYPQVNFASIDIIFSKEENKYRINQFWDITDDRGEFNPIAQRVVWITQSNGYIRDLNNNNLNYAKDPFQHKKFRHYVNSVFLRRVVSGNTKMMLKLVNNKTQLSLR